MDFDLEKMLVEFSQIAMQKSASDIDPPTEHPVGSADDGNQPAKTGEFAAENKSDAKEMGGPNSVTAQEGSPNPKDREDKPNQLPSGDFTDPAPADIKPAKTVESANTDSDTKSASAMLGELDSFLKLASAVLPVAMQTETTDKKVKAEDKKDKKEEKKEEKKEDKVEAEKCASAEADAKAQIDAMLAYAGVGPEASGAEKRAALIKVASIAAERAVEGFLLSLDDTVLHAALTGNIKRAAEDVMPTEDPAGTPAAGPSEDAAGAGAPAGGDQAQLEQVIQQLLEKAESGEITPEELIEQLSALGVDPESIQQLLQQAGPEMEGGQDTPAEAGGQAAPPPPEPESTPKNASAQNELATLRKAAAALLAQSVR